MPKVSHDDGVIVSAAVLGAAKDLGMRSTSDSRVEASLVFEILHCA
jgi:hypothetical protein